MKWIKVSERLPKNEILVVVKWDNGDITNLYFGEPNLELYSNITEWLDENDHSDEEAAFEAGRKYITIDHSEHQTFVDTQELRIKYPTFQDYQNSKNGKNDAVE